MPLLLLLINKLNSKKMVKMKHYHFKLIRLKNDVKQQIFFSHKMQNLTLCRQLSRDHFAYMKIGFFCAHDRFHSFKV